MILVKPPQFRAASVFAGKVTGRFMIAKIFQLIR